MTDLFLLEVEDARALITDLGLHASAFNFQKQTSQTMRDDAGTEHYVVMVVFGNHIVQYPGGYGMYWVARFEYDLCNGLIDRKLHPKK